MHKPAGDRRTQPSRTGRGGRRGRGNAGRGSQQCRPAAARRVQRARAEQKMKTELKLINTSILEKADDDDGCLVADADFNEDVLSHHASEASAEDEEDADDDADADADAEAYDAEHAVQGPMQVLEIPEPMRRCFRHWIIAMGALLRSLAVCARNPPHPQPKRVSLLHRHGALEWFALEATQTSPAVEGRIVTLDSRSRVCYQHPGPGRKFIVDIGPELALGTCRFLLHTRCEHVQAKAAERSAIPMDDFIITRCWQTLLGDDDDLDDSSGAGDMPRRGCGKLCSHCPMCFSPMSDCCVSPYLLSQLDMMPALQAKLDRATANCTTSPPMLLWELRRATLCNFCSFWFAERDADQRGIGDA